MNTKTITNHHKKFRNEIINRRESYLIIHRYKDQDSEQFTVSCDIIYDGYEGTVQMRDRLRSLLDEMNAVIDDWEKTNGLTK